MPELTLISAYPIELQPEESCILKCFESHQTNPDLYILIIIVLHSVILFIQIKTKSTTIFNISSDHFRSCH